MATSVDGVLQDRTRLSSFHYTGCDTRIVSLRDIEIPESATKEEYRELYERYTRQAPSSDPASNASLLRDAVESIKYGIAPPVAFPTETVYGLGADATNEPAISGIFAAKGRPSDNPLIVHVASVAHLERVTGAPLPEIYKSVADKFWPGPLTILLPVPRSGVFARNVHPSQSTIGFRVPSSKYARFFIAATDRPIAGPSANSSGKPSPTTARHVLDDLNGKINFILDGGDCEVGVESTVVDGLHNPPLVLRPGGVGLEEFRAFGREIGGDVGARWARTTIGYKLHHAGGKDLNANGTGANRASTSPGGTGPPTPAPETPAGMITNGTYDEDLNGAPRAPGMKYRHYAPRGRMILFSDGAVQAGRVGEKFENIANNVRHQGEVREVRIGIISSHWPPFAGLQETLPSTVGSNPDAISHSVYADITSVARIQQPQLEVTLYNVQLGPEIATLAHSLFGVLRLFDDLDCAYIFAETVQRSFSVPSPEDGNVNGHGAGGKEQGSLRQARHDLEDAVIDRIEKAAAERAD